jgi:hypothetical protein
MVLVVNGCLWRWKARNVLFHQNCRRKKYILIISIFIFHQATLAAVETATRRTTVITKNYLFCIYMYTCTNAHSTNPIMFNHNLADIHSFILKKTKKTIKHYSAHASILTRKRHSLTLTNYNHSKYVHHITCMCTFHLNMYNTWTDISRKQLFHHKHNIIKCKKLMAK